MQCSKRRRIRLCSNSSKAKGAFCRCVAWGWRIYNIVESESNPLTRRPVDLFEKEPLKGKWEVHLHTVTKFGKDPSKDLGGDREQTHKQTNAARIIVWCSFFRLTLTWEKPRSTSWVWYFRITFHVINWNICTDLEAKCTRITFELEWFYLLH